MVKTLQIVVYLFAVLTMLGCQPQDNRPIWEETKIGDLAPRRITKDPNSQFVKAINIDVYIIEVPVENIIVLNDIWPKLYTKPLRFNNYSAFTSNSLVAGFGQLPMWSEIRQMLLDAGGKKTQTVSILIPDGQFDTLEIVQLDDEQTAFYTSSQNALEAVTIGPGTLGLNLKSDKIPGSRGIRQISATPLYKPLLTSRIPQMVQFEESGRYPFQSAGFTLKMGPGDFVLLGPEKYIEHQKSLGSLLFSIPRKKPVVRVFLFVCSNIVD